MAHHGIQAVTPPHLGINSKYVDIKKFRNREGVFLFDGAKANCELIPKPEQWPNQWVYLAYPWCFKGNKQNEHFLDPLCLVCNKTASNDHLGCAQHWARMLDSTGRTFRHEYLEKIKRGEIEFPNDGYYLRDRYGTIINRHEIPADWIQGKHYFAPGEFFLDDVLDRSGATSLLSDITNSSVANQSQYSQFGNLNNMSRTNTVSNKFNDNKRNSEVSITSDSTISITQQSQEPQQPHNQSLNIDMSQYKNVLDDNLTHEPQCDNYSVCPSMSASVINGQQHRLQNQNIGNNINPRHSLNSSSSSQFSDSRISSKRRSSSTGFRHYQQQRKTQTMEPLLEDYDPTGDDDIPQDVLTRNAIVPVDCNMRPIPLSYFWYGHPEYCGRFAKEIYKGPHMYELFINPSGHESLRCRLCVTTVNEINSSHSWQCQKHSKKMQWHLAGAVRAGPNETTKTERIGNLPLPVKPQDILPGKHFPKDYDKRNCNQTLQKIIERFDPPPPPQMNEKRRRSFASSSASSSVSGTQGRKRSQSISGSMQNSNNRNRRDSPGPSDVATEYSDIMSDTVSNTSIALSQADSEQLFTQRNTGTTVNDISRSRNASHSMSKSNINICQPVPMAFRNRSPRVNSAKKISSTHDRNINAGNGTNGVAKPKVNQNLNIIRNDNRNQKVSNNMSPKRLSPSKNPVQNQSQTPVTTTARTTAASMSSKMSSSQQSNPIIDPIELDKYLDENYDVGINKDSQSQSNISNIIMSSQCQAASSSSAANYDHASDSSSDTNNDADNRSVQSNDCVVGTSVGSGDSRGGVSSRSSKMPESEQFDQQGQLNSDSDTGSKQNSLCLVTVPQPPQDTTPEKQQIPKQSPQTSPSGTDSTVESAEKKDISSSNSNLSLQDVESVLHKFWDEKWEAKLQTLIEKEKENAIKESQIRPELEALESKREEYEGQKEELEKEKNEFDKQQIEFDTQKIEFETQKIEFNKQVAEFEKKQQEAEQQRLEFEKKVLEFEEKKESEKEIQGASERDENAVDNTREEKDQDKIKEKEDDITKRESQLLERENRLLIREKKAVELDEREVQLTARESRLSVREKDVQEKMNDILQLEGLDDSSDTEEVSEKQQSSGKEESNNNINGQRRNTKSNQSSKNTNSNKQGINSTNEDSNPNSNSISNSLRETPRHSSDNLETASQSNPNSNSHGSYYWDYDKNNWVQSNDWQGGLESRYSVSSRKSYVGTNKNHDFTNSDWNYDNDNWSKSGKGGKSWDGYGRNSQSWGNSKGKY